MIIKKNGQKEEFNSKKVEETIKTYMAEAGYHDGFDDIIDKISLRAIARITRKKGDMDSLSITRYIRDAFVESGFTNVANKMNTAMYDFPDVFSICSVHGLFQGNENVCPRCGEKTKVYHLNNNIKEITRDTVQKTENNKTESQVKQISQQENTKSTSVPVGDTPDSSKVYYLFITPTCPNIDLICNKLKEKKIDYRLINASNPEHKPLFIKFGVTQAPSLVVDDGGNANIFVNAAVITKYIDNI